MKLQVLHTQNHPRSFSAALRFSRVGFAHKENCVTSESGRSAKLSNDVCHMQSWENKNAFPLETSSGGSLCTGLLPTTLVCAREG